MADFSALLAFSSEAEEARVTQKKQEEKTMKNRKLFVWMFAAIACGAVHAQTAVTANIPFEFRLGRAILPAGVYRIENVHQVLRFSCFKAHTGALIMTSPTSGGQPRTTGLLHFNRYGEAYFFAGMEMPNSSLGSVVLPSRPEKELARRLGTNVPAGVALSPAR
jgi:hypothetical protein